MHNTLGSSHTRTASKHLNVHTKPTPTGMELNMHHSHGSSCCRFCPTHRGSTHVPKLNRQQVPVKSWLTGCKHKSRYSDVPWLSYSDGSLQSDTNSIMGAVLQDLQPLTVYTVVYRMPVMFELLYFPSRHTPLLMILASITSASWINKQSFIGVVPAVPGRWIRFGAREHCRMWTSPFGEVSCRCGLRHEITCPRVEIYATDCCVEEDRICNMFHMELWRFFGHP